MYCTYQSIWCVFIKSAFGVANGERLADGLEKTGTDREIYAFFLREDSFRLGASLVSMKFEKTDREA